LPLSGLSVALELRSVGPCVHIWRWERRRQGWDPVDYFLGAGSMGERLTSWKQGAKAVTDSQLRDENAKLPDPRNCYAWAAFWAWNFLHSHKMRSFFFGSGLGRRTVQP